jgi:tRNA(Ile)-lysidine synthase
MDDFVQAFKDHIHQQRLFVPADRLLLAVSGGLDSMVLAELCLAAGYRIGLAHCNFKLRAEESDEDQAFVEKFAEHHSIPFFTTSFETTTLAAAQGKSIQVMARELRYHWLEEVRQQQDYDWILTAHHLNDAIETILYNFTKGCGLKGLQGIPKKNGFVIRPLLFARREELVSFAEAGAVTWREDSSNTSDKYARNRIRHQVIPVLKALNPSFETTVAGNIQRLQEADYLYRWAIEALLAQHTEDRPYGMAIHFVPLLRNPAKSTIFYEALRPYGFNGDQVRQALSVLGQYPNHMSGAKFFSKTYQFVIDRTHLIIEPQQNLQDLTYQLSLKGSALQLTDGVMHMEREEGQPAIFYQNNFTVCLDLPAEALPLTVRHWKAGDAFHPLGMKGKTQKLQDFFTHQKLNRLEKDRIWVVEAATGEIVWIVGLRIDHYYRVTPQTDGYYVLHFNKNNKQKN